MAGADDGIVGVEHGALGRPLEEFLGILDEVLVQGVLSAQKDDGRLLARAPHAAAALEGLHDAAGVSDQNAEIEGADVDAKLQGARGDDGQQIARGKAPLYLPALLGQEARPVGADAVPEAVVLLHGPEADELGHATRAAVDDGAQLPVEG